MFATEKYAIVEAKCLESEACCIPVLDLFQGQTSYSYHYEGELYQVTKRGSRWGEKQPGEKYFIYVNPKDPQKIIPLPEKSYWMTVLALIVLPLVITVIFLIIKAAVSCL